MWNSNPLDDQKAVGLSVHAGFPNPGDDKSLSSLDLHQLLIARPSSTFLFEVEGGDWETVGIFSGDVAIVDRALDARKTDLVIWWRGSEFAVSNFGRLPPGATIWGVVTSIIHRLRTSL